MLSIVNHFKKGDSTLGTGGSKLPQEAVKIGGKDFTFMEICNPSEYVCILFSEGRPVANATLSLMEISNVLGLGYSVCYFNRHFVHPSFRGHRLGTFILEKVLDFARREKKSIYNEVNPYGGMDLEQLTDFYVRHGFRILRKGVVYWLPE